MEGSKVELDIICTLAFANVLLMFETVLFCPLLAIVFAGVR
jgi:hypothetical protein